MAKGLSILNDPPRVLEGPQLLHHLIQWEKYNDTCALDFTSHGRRQRYSYREIQSCTRSLAVRIQEALSSCETEMDCRLNQHIVPILLPQSPTLYISQFAILESGGAFCPINLDAPKERIKFIVEDVAANIIITTSEFKDSVAWEGGPVAIFVDEFPDTPQETARPSGQPREVIPTNLAYVMYTSGSTGLPKGVTLSHLAVSQSLLAHEKHIPQFKRFLQFAAPSFDVSVFETFFPLIRGCTLVGCNRSQLLNNLPGMINELEVDAAELTPTVAGSLLQKRSYVPGLKLLLTIGEMLTRPIVDEFGGSETKDGILYGMYGPTEASIHCTILPKMKAKAKPGNIGIPFDTVSTFIAAASQPDDEEMIKFLPIGEVGELVLGGLQLAQGYLNRPEQNKASFVHMGGKDYYRTGDKARHLEDGTTEILGRMSVGQVKLRGQRVELGEIEEVVYKRRGVKTATAVVLSGSIIVFALIGGKSIRSEDILNTCAQWLPKFMVPSEIILLRNFPYLPSGKVDKRRLESDYQKQREKEASESIFTMSDTEKFVKETLQDLLGPFPSNMRLAAVGLDSLAAIRVASKFRSSGFAVTAVSVLQADTLTALAQACKHSRSKPKKPLKSANMPLEKIMRVLYGNTEDVEYVLPCTPLQSAMLLETAIDEKAYRNWFELHLPGICDIKHVISTLHSLAEHNPILRTGFTESQNSDGYVQIVWKALSDVQIEEVENFNYNFDKAKDPSLDHPLRIQVSRIDSSAKLLIHLHHALYDAWSLELLLDDLEALLKEDTLPPRPSFANVVGGYVDGTLSTDSWSSKDYWKDHLAHLDLRQLPNFHSGKASSPGLAISRLRTSISTFDIETAARRLTSSPQSLFQAAFALTLSSYLGSSDICFGTVFSGRTLPVVGIEDIVGPCLATLPVRIDVSTSATLKDLVQELNSTNRKHLEHSTLSLRDIKSASGINPRQRLFETLIIWQQTLHSYDHTRKHVSLVNTADNLEFNLTLEVIPGIGNIELKANYQQSLFPKSQIDFLLRQVEKLAQVIVGDQSIALNAAFSRLDISDLSAENVNPETLLGSHTLSSPVERVAAENPTRPAIEFAKSIDFDNIEVERMSYGKLNTRANQMGHYLLSLKVLPDEVVCICMEKSVDLYACILATAKVGAGYLPLTQDVPPERLQHILREAKVKVILAHSPSRPLLSSVEAGMVRYVDEVNFSVFSPMDIPARSSPENLSYCVFTSGSTGVPKGVLVTQGNLLSNLDILEDLYPASKDSRLLQSCSQAFDVSVFEIFFTWRIGACLCSAVKDVLFRDIENAIRLLGITHLSLTPTVAALIDPKNVPSVQFLVTAGEAVTQKVFTVWADRGLYQGYGPSETTNICTVNPKVTHHDSINNIGPPFKNTSAFVLSTGPEFTLVPRGGEGEFCFGGSQVFRGYMDRGQEVGKIIDHPTYGRLYRSGDFGRMMPDGSLAFTGRKDDQVKIRGQRVELGEIENVMLMSPEVLDCVTMVIGSTNSSQQRLICFWTSGSERSASLECLHPDVEILKKLYKNLEWALPAYMIPSSLIQISYLPSTTQGKIDKRLLISQYNSLSLSYLDSTSQATKSSSDHAWTGVELSIAKALAQVAKLPEEEISPDTSFFSLGIDSISAISFSRILRQNFQRPVEISDILKHRSVARLAEKLSSQTREIEGVSRDQNLELDFGFDAKFVIATTDNFKRAGKSVRRILPCTPLQEAMLSSAESSAEMLYRNQVILNVSGSVERLQQCWQDVIRRHEILRTCFLRTDMPGYAYVQVILAAADLKFGSIDEAASTSHHLVEMARGTEAPSQFVPPYSLDFVRSSGSTRLLISMHHALYDGVALAVLYEEIEALYHHHSLPPAVSFEPFLKSIMSMKTQESDQFWEATLDGVTPTRFERIDNMGKPQTRIQRTSSKCSLRWIDDSAKKHGASLLAICHAVWVGILSERLHESDICFGNVVSGRTVPVEGIERLVAPCFNTIPARLRNTHKLSYLEAFRKLQTFNADSLPFHLTPLRRIQSKCSPDGSRLFDTLFILQQPPRDLDSSIWSIEADSGAMDFPLVCEVLPKHREDTLEIILHSSSSIISEVDALILIETFSTNLESALQNPRRQLLPADVKEQIISKAISQEKEISLVENDLVSSKSMTNEELQLRDVIASFTDVPVEKIGPDVSIFRLGLDSISTVRVAAHLRKEGHSVLASDILENPTIAQLSSYLIQCKGATARAAEYDFIAFDKEHRDIVCANNGISSDQVEAIRPCTAAQEGMIARSLHSEGREYVNSMWFELLPETSLPKVKAAWDLARKEHEMLRTGFVPIEDPTHSFAMVTHTEDHLPSPWSDGDSDDWHDASIATRLLRRPWSLTLLNEGGTRIIKLTAHHALYDAQSMQMILSDVAKAYASEYITGRKPVTVLLGAILSNEEQNDEAKRLFWEREENKMIVNRFPDLTPLRDSNSSNSVREIFSQASTAGLYESCRRTGVTMQAATQATWARLLAAYIGESASTFQMTLSGRSVHEDADQISFPSIVTLPVQCNVVGTNAELLSRTMISNASLHKFQFTLLTSIQKWAGDAGKISDTLFTYQKLPATEYGLKKPWKVVREEASVDYAVSMEVQPTDSSKLALRLTFREDLIPVGHAELLLKQYDALLLDTLLNPQNPCDVAPKVEKELLSIMPAKQSVFPDSVSLLHEYVERGARTWPNKKALEFATQLGPGSFQSRSWTYEQLDKEGNKIAQLLVEHRVVPGQIIAICFDKCAEASFAIIGILKAGCAYVALDPNAPSDRLKFIVGDSGAKLVLTAGKPGQKVKESSDREIIFLDSCEILKNLSSDAPRLCRELTAQDTCYCLYTSGTTGTPKGCLITHENVVQAMLSFQRLFTGYWTDDSKWLQFASFHFDVSVLEQFWSWSVGICVASAPRDLIFEDIPGAIQQLGITHIDLTPSLARLLKPDDVPSLCKGVFITGGEQLKQEVLDAWGEHGCIYNGYGPTEATIGVTMYPRVPKNGRPSNIGWQFDNVGSFVLKPGTSLPVLRGGIGELCVSGKLVGKGYLNRPDLSTERFPTLEAFNERVYRSGDLVRILHDGSFIFLGRADDQVKLRGQRLELSEINEVIKNSMSNIQEVVTLVLKHTTQQKEQLVTFFVATALGDARKDGILISTMRDGCKAHLPGYMVPTHFIPIKALPLNTNNKADSKQLAAMYNDLTVDDLQKLRYSAQQDQEWTGKETKVIEVLARALHVEPAALIRGSNIFELGLDSISIIAFARALQNSGLENAKLSVVKSNTTIEKLVSALMSQGSLDQGQESAYVAASQNIMAFSQRHMVNICKDLGVESAEIERIAPCTPVQEAMIYRFLGSEQLLYFNKFEFRLREEVDTEKLLVAWNRVIARLQILRTKFIATDDGFAQVVTRKWNASWGNPPLNCHTVEKSLALRTPFTLDLISTAAEPVMLLRIFHGLYDGNSITMMLHCVVEEYNDVGELTYGPPFHSSLAHGPLAVVPGAELFWKNHLKQWKYNPMSTNAGSVQDVTATNTLSHLDGFDELRKHLGVTPQAVIQAAWLSVMLTLTSPDLTIGIVTSGRAIDFDEADKVIGPLFNTVPFHVKIYHGMTSSSLISVCHEFNMQIQDFQHTPLKDIQKWSPARPGQPLFESLFVFQRPEIEEDFGREFWTQLEDAHVADYPLAFEATLSPDSTKLAFTIVAQGSVVTQDQAISILDQMEKMLHEILHTDGKNLVMDQKAITTNHNGTPGSSSPQPDHSDVALDIEAENSPWTPQTELMRAEIAMLANVPEGKVRQKSSVFELGLDSIDIIKLSSRLRKKKIEIPVSTIIKCQTIARMTAKISAEGSQAQENFPEKNLLELSGDLTRYLKRNGKLPQDVQAVLPATPLQQSMVNEMINSGYQRYFTVEAFKLSDNVDSARLMAAIQSVIRQSPILRTSFIEIEDPRSSVSYAQIISNDYSYPSTYVLAGEQSFESFMDQFRTDAVDLAAEKQALCQVRFVRAGQKRYMIMAISHALYDGRSLHAIHEDIFEAYNGRLSPRPDFMPFLDHVFHSTTEHATNFWRSTLSNLPQALFPRKNPAEIPDSAVVHRMERRSHVPLKDAETFCKSSRITLQTLGQTCWALVLAHMMGQLDVIFGSVLSCRDSEEADDVMFPLMNTVAVRSVLHGNLTDMLKYMQEMSDTTRQYQHFPLGMAQAYGLASRDYGSSTNDTTLFDSLFIYQGRRPAAESEPLYDSVYGASEVEFPVCVEMEIVDDRYLSWTTACKSFARTAGETENILEVLECVLERITINPHAKTFTSSADGISICDLPKFKKQETRTNGSVKSPENANEAEWSSMESNLRRVLHEVSGVPEINIHKDSTIFHLGLDSILVLKLPALLRGFGIKLSVSDILREQTVSAMSQFVLHSNPVEEASLDVDGILASSISSVDITSELSILEKQNGEIQFVMPATAGQLCMIRKWRASGGVLFYPSFTYSLRNPIDKAKLDTAWRELLQRHDILRTAFLEIGSKLIQTIFKNPTTEVSYAATESQEATHDLKRSPLSLRVEECKGPDSKLTLKIHHCLYDGISLPILMDDLQSLYNGRGLQRQAITFRKFVAQSISSATNPSSYSSQTVTQEKWTSYLKPQISYPIQVYGSTLSAASYKKIEVFRPSMKLSPIKALAQTSGVTIDALFLAAIAKIYAEKILKLEESSRSSPIVFGIYLANRAPFGKDLSELAAPTLNLLPLCVRNPLSRAFTEVAKDVQQDLHKISSAEMSCASLADIYEWTGVRVNFFVNILKDAPPKVEDVHDENKTGDIVFFEPVQDLTKRAQVVDAVADDRISIPLDGKCEAYLPSVDLEIRYLGDMIDMGIFAPIQMLSIAEAESMIREFVKVWD